MTPMTSIKVPNLEIKGYIRYNSSVAYPIPIFFINAFCSSFTFDPASLILNWICSNLVGLFFSYKCSCSVTERKGRKKDSL